MDQRWRMDYHRQDGKITADNNVTVIKASPTPITACVPTITGNTTSHGLVPEIAISAAQAADAITTLAQLAKATATKYPARPAGLPYKLPV